MITPDTHVLFSTPATMIIPNARRWQFEDGDYLHITNIDTSTGSVNDFWGRVQNDTIRFQFDRTGLFSLVKAEDAERLGLKPKTERFIDVAGDWE